MTSPQEQPLDFDALLAMENASPVRHEYIGGKLYEKGAGPTPKMAGGTSNHSDIIHNVQVAVGRRMDDSECQGSSGDQRVRFEQSENWFYPDFLLKCPPLRFHPRDKNALMNPRAVFEVLSPETERFDRTGKFDQYATNPELSDYILISADEVRVEHFRRIENGDWSRRIYVGRDAELQLKNFDISVPLSEIYRKITLETQTILPFDSEI